VLRLGTEPVTEAMALLLRGSPEITFFKVHEVRTTLETDLAALAAQRASEEQVAELQEIVRLSEEAADLEVESQLDVDFHRAIARSAQNELYLVLLDSISGVLLENRRATLAIPHNPGKVIAEHKRILEAIKRHDPREAREAMEVHLAHVEEAWRTRESAD
jgi:GntR family transcriptional regulator, transcriptional repressor for pyruvate dehydrogenase complex